MKIDIDHILTTTTNDLCERLGVEVEKVPQVEALRYFRFEEIPFLLYFIAKKSHRTTMRAIGEQYELETGEFISYHKIKHIVSRFYDELERVKSMNRKAVQN